MKNSKPIDKPIDSVIDAYSVEDYQRWLRMELCHCYPVAHFKYPCAHHGDTKEDAIFYRERLRRISREMQVTMLQESGARRMLLAVVEEQALRETIERIRQRESPVLDFSI